MEEKLITFPTAKLAKTQGFPFFKSVTYGYSKDGHLGSIFDSSRPHTIPAPTQDLLHKWLQDEHDIDINIQRRSENAYEFIVTTDEYTDLRGSYKTYEWALEAGLQHALGRL